MNLSRDVNLRQQASPHQPARQRRGQPLLMLAAVLGSWTAARTVWWEGPSDGAFALAGNPSLVTGRSGAAIPVQTRPSLLDRPGTLPETATDGSADAEDDFVAGHTSAYAAPRVRLAQPAARPGPALFVPEPPPARLAPDSAVPRPAAQISAGHQLLWMAALSALPLPGSAVRPALAGMRSSGQLARAPALPRWSADGWLLLRPGPGGAPSAAGALVPSYGASQVGAVIRYRLGSRAHGPALFLRATSALDNPRDPRLAAGIALRPLARVPLVPMAELRAGHGLHPALSIVTALAPMALPLAARAELYAQAGYVAGGRDATAFVDGQLRADRAVARLGSAELRAGGGVWGGAQKGAARLDIGPGAVLHLTNVAGGARLALDWRFRIAGDAAPRSGPALTLSAGF